MLGQADNYSHSRTNILSDYDDSMIDGVIYLFIDTLIDKLTIRLTDFKVMENERVEGCGLNFFYSERVLSLLTLSR